MSRARSDLRNWTVSEKNELKKYFMEHGWKYDPSIPSRIRMNGIPKAYNGSSIILPIGDVNKNVPRWQMIEFLATGDVKHTPAECTAVYKPSDKEINSFHRQKSDAIKALRADMDRLEGVVDREVVSEGIPKAKAAVGSSEAFVAAIEHGTMNDILREMKSPLEISNDQDKLLFDRLTIVPESMEVRLSFTSLLTNRYAKVSSLDERSFAEYTGLPKTLDLKARFLILSKLGYELAMSDVGTMNMSGFCGEIGNGNYLSHKY